MRADDQEKGDLAGPCSGRCRWPDGREYTGALLRGRPHGLGKMRSADGFEYEGQFHMGRPHGYGTLRGGKTQPSCYEGEFQDGKRHGQGELRLSDGRVYTGAFVHGEAQGNGVLRSPDGTVIFEGMFQAAAKASDGSVLVVKPAGKLQGSLPTAPAASK